MEKQYVEIPGFSKYEISEDAEVRNIKTKEVCRLIALKVFIYNDEKKRVMVLPADLLKLVSFGAKPKKEAVKKEAKKPAVKKEKAEAGEAPVRGTKIKEILDYYESGKTKEEIIALGYHKTTVAIQIAKREKEKASKKK